MDAKIFSTPSCGYCKQAKSYLKQAGVRVKEVDISKDQRAAEEMVRKTGQQGVPVIIMKGTTIVGFDKNKINRVLGIN
ncbi:MAG: glutathione S-transferase N-terminal domain-containing protein [Spirochaetota bacterium]|nr:glutathione S-transferase N-terminal domain-containing protein [Spirochaetota bacterium]